METVNDKSGSVFVVGAMCINCNIQLRHYEVIDYHNGKCEYCQDSMKTFEKKIKRLLKLKRAGWNYIYDLKNPRLTNGFWNKYGYNLDELLEDIYENHPDEMKSYCDANNLSDGRISVDDLMC